MRRFFDDESFQALNIDIRPAEVAAAHNLVAGTLRGLHYQVAPATDAKVVCCTRGRLFDVAVDLRPGSPGFGAWQSFELDADNPRALFVPAGCAHGYLTLEPDTDLLYIIGASYCEDLQRGVRWDDPTLNITWPFEPHVLSERDKNLPHLTKQV